MKKPILVLNGIHSSGKSKIGKYLMQRGYDFHIEVAGTLIGEGAEWGRWDGKCPYDIGFQQKVMKLEIERDKEILRSPGLSVVETYHIGNIAHVQELDGATGILETYKRYFSKIASENEILAVFLEIKDETMKKRNRLFEKVDDGVLSFYHRIKENIFDIYREFDIEYVTLNNDSDAENTCFKVENVIRGRFR